MLYPSLNQCESAKIVPQLVLESDVQVSGIDYRSVQIFCASNMSEEEVKAEGLTSILPTRSKTRGQRPGPTTEELRTKVTEDGTLGPTKWTMTDTEKDLQPPQKRILLATAVRLLTILIFSNHMYQFGGVNYRQLIGGPIGLRLTSVVARVVMDRWSKLFLSNWKQLESE